MEIKEPYITAQVELKSTLQIEALGKIISFEIFGDIPFEGLDEAIYDEIPAIYFKRRLLGFNFVLQNYDSFEDGTGYCLTMIPDFTKYGTEFYEALEASAKHLENK